MLSEEEKKAIDIIKYNDIGHPLACGDITICSIEDLQTILNLIEKQDKIINEMTEWIEDEQNNKVDGQYTSGSYMLTAEEIRQYFEEKVKEFLEKEERN